VRLYDHVAVVAPGSPLDRRAALAAAARSRSLETSVDEPLREARARLAALDESVPSPADARRAVAEAESELAAQRERVATLRGRLQAADDAETEASYRTAVRTLSELETDYQAAGERLTAARERARSARDVRERRFGIQDRIGNLERTARAELVSAMRPAAEATVAETPAADAESYHEAAPVSAMLVLIRIGVLRLPVVLACRRFPDAPAAESWLDSPVIKL
jgi:exonuclease VII small subunit